MSADQYSITIRLSSKSGHTQWEKNNSYRLSVNIPCRPLFSIVGNIHTFNVICGSERGVPGDNQGNLYETITMLTSHTADYMSTAEAFYRVFCALSKKDRMAVAGYIFQDTEVRHNLALTEIPNEQTVKSFAEDKSRMPVFTTVKSLREDLLS